MESGVNFIPEFAKDNSDRNRTSPFAFTGNKFEFRSVGSSASLAGPNTVLNTMIAEEFRQFADELETVASEDLEKAIRALVARELKAHSRIIFNGDGYKEEWVVEAERRGLANLRTCADAIPALVADKNVDLFEKHSIYTKAELESRCEIQLENYCTSLRIEALTMIDMVKKDIYPTEIEYMKLVTESISKKMALGLDIPCESEKDLLKSLASLSDSLMKKCSVLEAALADAEKNEDIIEQSNYFRDVIFPAMQEMRAVADELETITAKDYWPYPTYSDLLYSVV